MATEIYLVRGGAGLVPADEASQQVFEKLPQGHVMKASITAPRSLKHHRLFFGLVHLIFKNQSLYKCKDDLVDDFKISTGHYELRLLNGEKVIKTKSISFAKMNQVAFSEFYERCLDVIFERIIPGLQKDSVRKEVYDMVGIYE